MKFQAPKGVSEYFPPRSYAFDLINQKFSYRALSAGYKLIELPIFEETELFTRGVGESTDVVSKEMYTFEDRGGRSITLRPEGTAGVARSVIEHGLDRGQLPVKVFYRGPFFRAERPQAGRYRQFFQFGIEAIGVSDPLLDVEVISLADRSFRALGLRDFHLDISSLGDAQSRTAHREDLQRFISGIELDEESRQRAERNPLRLFDDKREEVRRQMENAPILLEYLSDSSNDYFQQVQEGLHLLGISFQINPRMVRGLDYYTGTAFEFVHHRLGAQSGIGGGGRYDGLMETLGGQDLSGIGFGLGIDRTLLAMEAEEIDLSQAQYIDIYLVPLGESARLRAMVLLEQLRESGFVADMAYGSRALKGAMKAADKLSARHLLVIGDEELSKGEGFIKRLSDGYERVVKLDSLAQAYSDFFTTEEKR
jgi:histidyl-tRNA synthetase